MTRARWTPVLAAVATVLTMWSMSPVIDGAGWWGPSLLMVLLALLVGLGLRELRVPEPVVAPAQLLAGLIGLTAVYAGSDAVLGLLPGPDALRTLGAIAADGSDTIARYQAPVPIASGISLLVTVGVLVVAVLVDLTAVALRAPAAAGLPLLALYCVPSAVVQDGLSWRYFVAAALGWLLLLAHDAGDRVLGWGRLLPRWASRQPGTAASIATDTGAMAATGRRLGIAAIAVAVLVPSLAPGLSEGLLTRGGGGSGSDSRGGLTVINPVLSLRDNLAPRRDVEVLTYSTTQDDLAPLRILTADNFDGTQWEPTTTDPPRSQRASRGLPNPPGLSTAVARDELSMRINVGSTLNQDFLPLPYPTRDVDIDGRWLYDASSLNVRGDGETVRGKSYTADYLVVKPTADQLRTAQDPPSEITRTFTRLPRSLPDVVRTTAVQVTAGATTKYDQAMALQQWFREKGGFTYSTQAPVDAGGDAVAEFLVDKAGYCVQFSSAMAVMARTLGIPARIAVGFLPGKPAGANTHSVMLTDAHAWPELFFTGAGWVRFEPTPATRAGVAPSWATPAIDVAPSAGPSTAAPGADTGNDPSVDPRLKNLPDQEAVPTTAPSAGGADAASGFDLDIPWRTVLLVLLVLAVVGLAPAAAALARWRRHRAAQDDPARIEAAWADLFEGADDLGYVLAPGSTPRQAGAELALAAHLPSASPDAVALGRLAQAVERSRYARSVTPAGDVDADVRSVLRAVAATRTRGQRTLARVLPRSGTSRISRLGDNLGQRVGGLDQRLTARLRDLRGRRPRIQRKR